MKKQYKKLSPMMLSVLSAGLGLLGFGSCGSGRVAVKETQQKLEAKLSQTMQEEAMLRDVHQNLIRQRDEAERMGRGVCVYGGPNMSREEIDRIQREAEESQKKQAEIVARQLKDVEYKLDSIQTVKAQTISELESLNKKK